MEELLEVIRELYLRGFLPATSGNFSIRLDRNHLLITPSGKHKGKLKREDFILVDLEGKVKEEGKKPSAETFLHVAVYKTIPWATCVMHVHSPNATLISKLLDREVILEGYELLKAFDGIETHEAKLSIPIFENSQDMVSLSEEVRKYLEENRDIPAFLLRAHGLYTWGKSVQDAFVRLEALDFLFGCELKLLSLRGFS